MFLFGGTCALHGLESMVCLGGLRFSDGFFTELGTLSSLIQSLQRIQNPKPTQAMEEWVSKGIGNGNGADP